MPHDTIRFASITRWLILPLAVVAALAGYRIVLAEPPLFELDPSADKPADKPAETPSDKPVEPAVPEVDAALLQQILAAAEMPAGLLPLLDKLPVVVADPKALATLRDIDRELGKRHEAVAQQAAAKLAQIIAKSGELKSRDYLQGVFETTPLRRSQIAIALARYAQTSAKKPLDWQLMVRTLPVLDGDMAREVLRTLKTFRERGTKANWLRQTILLGLRLPEAGAAEAVELLEYWTGTKQGTVDQPALQKLAAWQAWYQKNYPENLPAIPPVEPAGSKHKVEDLLKFLDSDKGRQGDAARGAIVFEKGQCVKCHRFKDKGETLGPELTRVIFKLHPREIVEGIVMPSHNILDEYATKRLITKDGRIFTGLLTVSGKDFIILQASGEKVTIPRIDGEDIQPVLMSAMPEGLLNAFTQEDLADLFALFRASSY